MRRRGRCVEPPWPVPVASIEAQSRFIEEYMAPEVIKKEAYGLMVDWSGPNEVLFIVFQVVLRRSGLRDARRAIPLQQYRRPWQFLKVF